MKLSADQKEANKLARKKQREQEKEQRRIQAEQTQKPVHELTPDFRGPGKYEEKPLIPCLTYKFV